MTVIEIHKDRHMELAGKPWKECLAKATGDIKAVDIQYGAIDRAKVNDPVEVDTVASLRPRLAYNHVWLREYNGKAFLYLCNY